LAVLGPTVPPPADNADVPPDLFTAFQQQLGLPDRGRGSAVASVMECHDDFIIRFGGVVRNNGHHRHKFPRMLYVSVHDLHRRPSSKTASRSSHGRFLDIVSKIVPRSRHPKPLV